MPRPLPPPVIDEIPVLLSRRFHFDPVHNYSCFGSDIREGAMSQSAGPTHSPVRRTFVIEHGPTYLSLARVSEPVAKSGPTVFCGGACAPPTQDIASFNSSCSAILVQSRSTISQARRVSSGMPHASPFCAPAMPVRERQKPAPHSCKWSRDVGCSLRGGLSPRQFVGVSQYHRAQAPPAPHTAHLRAALRTWRLVVLATQTPPTRVLPTPHPRATCVVMASV